MQPLHSRVARLCLALAREGRQAARKSRGMHRHQHARGSPQASRRFGSRLRPGRPVLRDAGRSGHRRPPPRGLRASATAVVRRANLSCPTGTTGPQPGFPPWRVTFLARVLNLSPSAWTTVIVTAPVLLVLMSRTIPDFPACVPAVTVQASPSLTSPAGFDMAGSSSVVLRLGDIRPLSWRRLPPSRSLPEARARCVSLPGEARPPDEA